MQASLLGARIPELPTDTYTRRIVMDRYSKNKKSIYLSDIVLEELLKEAQRLDRSVSWLLTQSWHFSKGLFAKLPTVESK